MPSAPDRLPPELGGQTRSRDATDRYRLRGSAKYTRPRIVVHLLAARALCRGVGSDDLSDHSTARDTSIADVHDRVPLRTCQKALGTTRGHRSPMDRRGADGPRDKLGRTSISEYCRPVRRNSSYTVACDIPSGRYP